MNKMKGAILLLVTILMLSVVGAFALRNLSDKEAQQETRTVDYDNDLSFDEKDFSEFANHKLNVG